MSAGLHLTYNKRKNGLEEAIPPLRGIENILWDSNQTIIYQEHCMNIAKQVAGFSDNHADSYLRKSLAKGDVEKMELCRRWLIYGKINQESPKDYNHDIVNQVMYDPTSKYGLEILGGINNGYKEQELNEFWDGLKGYSSYLFNKSHATSYSLLSNITAWLKAYYPIEFFSAVLTLQDNDDKCNLYMKQLPKKNNIAIKAPDINVSNSGFTPDPFNSSILFGLSSIKSLKSAVTEIVKNRPYTSLEDMLERIPKKSFNKTVATNLIKAGALDNLYGGPYTCNRNALLNKLYDLRKDKNERLIEEDYNNYLCMEYEQEVLGTMITYRPWYDDLETNTSTTFDAELLSLTEKIDKNNNMMAFATVKSDNCEIELIIFASTYNKCQDAFDVITGKYLTITGKKDDKGKLLVSKAIKNKTLN